MRAKKVGLSGRSLSRIVKEMIELLRVSGSKHGVAETNLGKDLPAVEADAAVASANCNEPRHDGSGGGIH